MPQKHMGRVAVTGDGRYAAAASRDGFTRIFDLKSRKFVHKVAAGVGWQVMLPVGDTHLLLSFKDDSSVLLDAYRGVIEWRVPW
ncbi:hypothetical protein [Acidicapsa acidisoli]|uniref:hypothetical protein n=1 Tax=Acidicapsa acidisoli TaxID=1615681 RepID=UPI0021E0CF02|nr:hypothetical protein [Acidicapsa acidisoli]